MMKYPIVVLLMLAVFTACRQGDSMVSLPVENAVYYWRTSWRLDSIEMSFLGKHDIHRVFCRYFDVVMSGGEPMPNATIRFEANNVPLLPTGIELVPTVYITADCMNSVPQGGWSQLAERLVQRVIQMNETHDLPTPRELQVDCDYTQRNRQTYYDFLDLVRLEASKHSIRLSTTIRLHQLSMSTPPADYGVLMIYNTGDPQNFAERNPILDVRDVQPYLRYLAAYPLPLAAAYPVYQWQRTIGGVRIEHSVEASEILKAKEMVERERPDMGNTIIIYSLDKENIDRYDNETFSKIFSH